MRGLRLNVSGGDKPAYLRLAKALRDAIRAGALAPGELAPSTRVLGEQVGMHRHTVMTAMDELVAEGWLEAEPRRGYRVVATLPSIFLASTHWRNTVTRGKNGVAAEALARVRQSAVPDDGPALLAPARYDLRSGRADLRLFPTAELKSHWSDALKREGTRLLDYGDPGGHPPFLAELSTYLRRARSLSGRELVATHGSQEAIYLTGRVLLRPGDCVAMEALSYPAARAALAATGATIVPIPVDGEGADPEGLARLARRRRVRLLYLTPLHQYPTTVTLSPARRGAIYELAARHGITILEDDYDHEYHYRCQPLAPLAAADPAGVVIYVSTLSKVLYPSARLGFAALPPGLAPAFREARKMVSSQSDTLLQAAVARWMRDGGFERHLARTRRHYERRLQATVAALESAKSRGIPLDFRAPDGGMALWLKTSCDTAALARTAAKAGVLVHPEAPARMDGRPGKHLRLGFARHTPEEMQAALRILLAATMG